MYSRNMHIYNEFYNKVLLSFSRIFVVDLLNFSFWSDDESRRYAVTYRGKAWTGYWSLCAAINRAIDVTNHAFHCLMQGFSHPLPAGKKMPAEPPKNARLVLKENVILSILCFYKRLKTF